MRKEECNVSLPYPATGRLINHAKNSVQSVGHEYLLEAVDDRPP